MPQLSHLLLPCLIILSLSVSASEERTVDRIRVTQYTFDVPSRFSLGSARPAWLKWITSADESKNSFLFLLPAEVLSAAIEGYKQQDGAYKEDIRVYVAALNRTEQERYAPTNQHFNLWQGRLDYKDRIVEKSDDGNFRVYRKLEYPYSWALVKAHPEALPQLTGDFWIAHCIKNRGTITTTGEHIGCTSHLLKDDILIEFNISEQNLSKIDSIKHYLSDQVMTWKVE